MTTTAYEASGERELLASHIQHVRERLARIRSERVDFIPDGVARTADLIDEERTLESLLAELRERARQVNSLPR